MGFTNFVLPDLGEGLTESEIASWRVAEGERVVLNQVVAEVETAKALVELPSPYDGVIARLYVSEGVVVNVGDPIIAFELDRAEEPPGGVLPEGTETTTPDHEAAPPNLVGYGAVSEAKALGRRARKQGAPLHQGRRRRAERSRREATHQAPGAPLGKTARGGSRHDHGNGRVRAHHSF